MTYPKLGGLVEVHILKLRPHKVAGCFGLLDIYANVGRWEDVISVKRLTLDMDIEGNLDVMLTE